MNETASEPIRVLVTGGTSGLGLRLVRLFLEKGYEVVTTGRQPVKLPENAGRFAFLMTDFSDLKSTSESIKELCRKTRFDIVINNAGVLSPPDLLVTDDGFEYTFQVNFLSHLLLDEIVLSKAKPDKAVKILSITSPVYRIADPELNIRVTKSDYRPFKAYANSKLYLALMCSKLPARYPSCEIKCVAFDPGVFSSGIYRMQKKWFRMMYRIGAPFMSGPEKTARRIVALLETDDLISGMIYKSTHRKKKIPGAEKQAELVFWKTCYEIIAQFLA